MQPASPNPSEISCTIQSLASTSVEIFSVQSVRSIRTLAPEQMVTSVRSIQSILRQKFSLVESAESVRFNLYLLYLCYIANRKCGMYLLFWRLPIFTVKGAVLHGFRNMNGINDFAASHICDSACNL